MNTPTFSIITATCGRSDLLARALHSILSQTFRDFEAIVVNDYPEDEKICNFVNDLDDARIVFVSHGSNRGVAAAYNTGIKTAKGRWISFLGDDDEYLPAFLERTYSVLQFASDEVGFSWTGIRKVRETPEGEHLLSEKTWPCAFRTKEDGLMAATSIGNGYGLAIKRECFDIAGIYDESFPVAEDTEHMFRLARHFEFTVIPEILVKIHQHQRSQLTDMTRAKTRVNLYLEIMNRNQDLLQEYPRLNAMHTNSLIELCYRTGMRSEGRRALREINRTGRALSKPIMDSICYELFGQSALKCFYKVTQTLKGTVRQFM